MRIDDADAGTRRWGIAQWLVLFVLIVLTPFVVLEVLRGAQDVADRRASIAERSRGQVSEEAETMGDFIRFTERYLATLAADPAIRAFDVERIGELFQAVRDLNPNYINVFLVAADGHQVASTTPGVTDPEITTRPYFRDALASGEVEISGVLAWRDTGRSAVVFAMRVTDAEGRPIGVLSTVLNLARLSTVIGFVSLPEGSIVLLTQRDGAVIAASADPEGWVGQSLANTTGFGALWESRDRTKTLTMPDGTERVVSARPVEGTPWLMLAGIPEAEADAAMRESFLHVAVLLALTGLATAALAWIVLRRVVVPIRVLSEGALAFAAGFLHRRIPLKRADELGDLADALNSMAASLERRLEEDEAHALALRELNRLQAEFVATASHELRTPVTAIRTYAEALMRPEIADDETRRACLEGLDRASERLARLARTLLDVSRIDRGRVLVSLGPVDVAAAIRAAVAQGGPWGDLADVVVETDPDLPPAFADPDRLEDVLANLIGNARKFSPAGAPVVVRTGADGAGEIRIDVIDRGPGIPLAEQGRIFDRFYQVQRGADRAAGGSGLGLYIARGYTAAMGGRLSVQSEPGRGSTFTVALPRAPGVAARPARAATASPAG